MDLIEIVLKKEEQKMAQRKEEREVYGAMLMDYREDLGISRTQMAQQLSISYTRIKDLEEGSEDRDEELLNSAYEMCLEHFELLASVPQFREEIRILRELLDQRTNE